MLLQCIKKKRSKAEVSLHELLWSLRTVHARKVKDEVAVTAVAVKFFWSGVYIVFVDFTYCHVTVALCLTLFYIIKLSAKVSSNETFCASYQDLHTTLNECLLP